MDVSFSDISEKRRGSSKGPTSDAQTRTHADGRTDNPFATIYQSKSRLRLRVAFVGASDKPLSFVDFFYNVRLENKDVIFLLTMYLNTSNDYYEQP